MKNLVVIMTMIAMVPVMSACQRTPGEVVNKVLVDFGIEDKPEGYSSMTDQVFARLDDVARAEITRMNQVERNGEVKFEEEKGMRGKYYKQRKQYEDFYPLAVEPASRTGGGAGDRGYFGFIKYGYQVYESPRVDTSSEAEAAKADIPTGETGREVYRYEFSAGGVWDGSPGRKARK